MQAAARQVCTACAGRLHQLGSLRRPLTAAASCRVEPPGSWMQTAPRSLLRQQCPLLTRPLPHHAGGTAMRLPKSMLAAQAAASASGAGGRKPKKHKRPATRPGPLPLQTTPDKPVVILGIDPDASGAVVVLEWDPQAPRTAEGRPRSLADAELQVFDMPMETIALNARSRRQADAQAISELLHDLLPSLTEKAAVHCILEQPVPNALNGKFSWFQSGYAYGVWNGVLAAFQMTKQVVSATRWKRDLGLYGQGKEGSRQLALALYPQAAQQLKRKKDHGRAEALLLAAWASGIELPQSAFDTAQAAVDGTEPAAVSKSVSADTAANEDAELPLLVSQEA